MKKYVLYVSGYEVEASCHEISKDEYRKLISHQEQNDIKSPIDMIDDIESMVENYDRYNGDMFHITESLFDDSTTFRIVDEDDNGVLTFSLNDIEHDDDLDLIPYEEYDVYSKDYSIFYCEYNKGTLFGIEFFSDTVPTVGDFDYLRNSINSPDGDIDILCDIFFKKEKQFKNHDHAFVRGKNAECFIVKNSV